MYLLVSCQYVHVCVAITRLLLQKCLSMKCMYVHVSAFLLMYLHVSACICMCLQIIKHWQLLWQWLGAVFMTMWACNLGCQCVLEPGEPGPDSPLFYINTWAMVWPNDYPALATWNVHGNKTDPVWFCLWCAASVTGSVSPCTKPSAVASTALIQRIPTDRCHILTDSQYTVQGLLFSAHSARKVRNTYTQILADTCRYFV
jgi:hypothetical protein